MVFFSPAHCLSKHAKPLHINILENPIQFKLQLFAEALPIPSELLPPDDWHRVFIPFQHPSQRLISTIEFHTVLSQPAHLVLFLGSSGYCKKKSLDYLSSSYSPHFS